jgi:hypothetical protein
MFIMFIGIMPFIIIGIEGICMAGVIFRSIVGSGTPSASPLAADLRSRLRLRNAITAEDRRFLRPNG